MKKFGLVGFFLVGLMLISACQGAAPAPAPALTPPPAPVPTPPPAPVPTPPPAPEEPKASASSIAKGGLIYDKWWKAVDGATEPTEDHPLWALQNTNTRSGSTSWRCKECHGWDYKGQEGAYSQGSHYTGFPGVYDAYLSKTKAQFLDAMTGGINSQHDFSSVLSEAALENLVDFLKEGIINDVEYIDYATKKPIGADVAHGEELFANTCVACHGTDGKQINFHDPADPEYVGTVASGNPWEALHKIRFCQPGTSMPSAIVNDWSIQDILDVLGYAQTLPEE